MNLVAIVESLGIQKPLSLRDARCPDQYIGTVDELSANREILTRIGAGSRPDRAGVIVVLESPHIDEFQGEPGPARGPTGRLLSRYLKDVLGAGAVDDRPVILVNAVQLQCSLGMKPVHHRNRVFTAVWNKCGRDDFKSRMRMITRPGDIILCACTKGEKREGDLATDLRQLVYAAICEWSPQVPVVRSTHPASWARECNRKYEWAAV